VGQSEILLDSIPPGNTARQVFRRLVHQYPGLERYRKALLVAVNQEYTDWEQEVSSGDEIAFFPPVSGGAA
jgi:molybdopterin synthase catalytic subunit